MSFPSRHLLGAVGLALAPVSVAAAQNAGKTLAMDFRTTISIKGMPDTTVMLAHAVGTPEKMRLEVRSTEERSEGQVNPFPRSDSAVTMIITDSGKTITYLDTKKNQYLRVRPAEMVSQAQQMGGMKMEFSGTEAKVDSLGAGPTILGHPTTHYRTSTGMTMKVSAMGKEQTVQISNTTDSYFATDIKATLNPFASLSGGDMVNMFGTANADFAQKLKAAQAKLPKGTQLRALSSATIVTQGETRVTKSTAEVTSLQWVNTDPKTFDVPSTYTQVQLPSLSGANAGGTGGAIPPK